MTAVKPGDIDRLVAQPPGDVLFYLVYGPDHGLAGERAAALVRKLSGGTDDPFSLVKMDAATVASDSRRLADEAYTISLFGGRRTLWVRDAGGRANIVPGLAPLFANPPRDAVLVVDAGDLKKTAPLRTMFEKHGAARAIPCYVDDEDAVARLVDQMSREAGLQVAPDARKMLAQMLGGDRLVTRGEIDKLMLYARGTARVTADDVMAVVGEGAAFGLDEVLDAAATGDLAGLGEALERAAANDTGAQTLLIAALRHFQMLDQARVAVDAGATPANVVEGMRPPVFFKRKPMMIKALQLWTGPRLARAVQVLGEAQLKSRRAAALDMAITADVLFVLARIAATRGL